MKISEDIISPGGDRYRRGSSRETLPEFSPDVPSSSQGYLSARSFLGFDRESKNA